MYAGFRFSKRSVCLPAALLVGVLAVSGRAMGGQQLTTDATIIGQVTDEQGGVLPGVTVTATGPALQVPNVTAVTDERGEYRLTPLLSFAKTVTALLAPADPFGAGQVTKHDQ